MPTEPRCRNCLWPRGYERPLRCELVRGHDSPHSVWDERLGSDRRWSDEPEPFEVEAAK